MISRLKYRAFISYSHRDTPWARWLHNALERYRIDGDLVGKATPTGPVPKTLRPIFRDRDEFSAGHSLTEQSLAALDASQFLVVLCSPNAARSKYVNEEVRHFKANGGVSRVIPIIVAGEPGDPTSDCFPPALRFEVGPDGRLTDAPEEPLAADARPQGDGKEMAKQKVIAALLGLGLDEIMRRAERARKRRLQFMAALAALFLLLAVAATGSAVYAYQKLVESNERLGEAIEIAYGIVTKAAAMSDRYGVPQDLTLELLGSAEHAIDGLFAKGANTPLLKHREAMMLISFADSYRLLGRYDDAMRRIAGAREIFVDLTAGDPGNAEWQNNLAIAEYKTGDIEYYWGHYVAALEKFRSSIRMFEEHPVHQSGGLSFVGAGSPAYYLFWSYGKAAMAGLYAGKVDEILANVQSAYAVSERFASANSNDTLAKRNLAMSHLLMCEAARLHGTYREALDQCRTAASSLESIVATEHDNSRWQRDLGWAKIDLGAVLMRRGSLEEAAAAFRSAVSINEQLVASDPKNMLWHSYLAGANLGLAQSLVWLKKLDDALSNCRAVAALADPFASDERNYKFRRFLAWSRLCVGDVRKAQSDFEEALKSYRDGFALLQGLAHLDPVGAIRKSDLAWAYDKIGDALSARGRGGEALDSYRMATTLAQQIAGADPNNADWEWVLLWSEWRRAEHGDEAAASLGDIVARIRKLKSEDRLSADLAWLLPMAEARLAKLSGE